MSAAALATAARLLALDCLGFHPGARAFNVGNGRRFRARQVIAAASAVTVRVVPWEMAPRRAGDPAVLVASSGRARAELGWSPAWTSLEAII